MRPRSLPMLLCATLATAACGGGSHEAAPATTGGSAATTDTASPAAEASPAWLDNGVTAHRGDSVAHPENTLAAFQGAIDVGADWIELDIRRTRDGQLVVIHDETTGRVAGDDLVVADSDYAQLASLDVAVGHRREQGSPAEGAAAVRAPLLAEALELIKAQRRTRVSIQPKCDCVEEAVRIVQELDALEWVGFNDADLAKMRTVKELAPTAVVFWDRGPEEALQQDIETARELGFEYLVVHHTAVDTALVQRIHDAGLRAGAWTVNEPDEMRRILSIGVDRIYTDHPGLLLRMKVEMRP